MPRGPAIAIFARTPAPGKVKTRLIPLLGAKGAADFHGALLQDTIRKTRNLSGRVAKHLFFAPLPVPAPVWPRSFHLHAQRGRNLGERMQKAFDELFRGHAPVVIVGADSPLVPASRFALALQDLKTYDAALGPCADGGYYLIGLRRPAPGVLRRVRWGGRFAFRDTLRNLLRAGLSCSILEMSEDVDTPRDFARLKREFRRHPAARRLAPRTWAHVKQARSSALSNSAVRSYPV